MGINELDSTGMLKTLHSKMQSGDVVFVLNSIKTIRLIGVVTGEYYYNNNIITMTTMSILI